MCVLERQSALVPIFAFPFNVVSRISCLARLRGGNIDYIVRRGRVTDGRGPGADDDVLKSERVFSSC